MVENENSMGGETKDQPWGKRVPRLTYDELEEYLSDLRYVTTIKEASVIARCSQQQIRYALDNDQLAGMSIGGLVLISTRSLKRWIKAKYNRDILHKS